MKWIIGVLFLLFLFANTALYGQFTPCPITLQIAVELEKIKPDSIVIDISKDGVSSRITDRFMRIKATSNDISIVSFRCISDTDDGDILVFENKGEYLSIGILQMISSRKKGTIVYFECIKAVSKAGASFILRPFTLTL